MHRLKWFVWIRIRKTGKLYTVFSLKSGTDSHDLFKQELEKLRKLYTVFSLKNGTDWHGMKKKLGKLYTVFSL